jgi:homoserine kinase
VSGGARRVVVEVPASSANLGVGFDCLALALDLRLRVEVEVLPAGGMSELQVSGEGAGRLGLNDANRFVAGLRRGLAELGHADEDQAWRIEMDNEIPVGRGLGSSAAAAVAGLLCAEALSGTALEPQRLLGLATAIEGHPDNVAAALVGGFVVVTGGPADGAAWRTLRIEPPAELRAVVFIPELELPTSRMRAALPDTVPRADAVHNLGRAAMLVAAMASGELSLLSAMCEDRLHEPYRAPLFPQFPELEQAAMAAGALGSALSGAGSTVIALCRAGAAEAILEAMSDRAAALSLDGVARIVAPRSSGGQLIG